MWILYLAVPAIALYCLYEFLDHDYHCLGERGWLHQLVGVIRFRKLRKFYHQNPDKAMSIEALERMREKYTTGSQRKHLFRKFWIREIDTMIEIKKRQASSARSVA